MLVIVERQSGVMPIEARLLTADTALELQVAINQAAADGFRLWRRSAVAVQHGQLLTLMKRSVTDAVAYKLIGPIGERELDQFTRDQRPVGFAQDEHAYLIAEVSAADVAIAADTAPPQGNLADLAARKSSRPVHSFHDLQFQRYEGLGSQVVAAGPNESIRGTLVGVDAKAVSLRVDGRMREIAERDVLTIRSRTATKKAAAWGAVVGVSVGLGLGSAGLASRHDQPANLEGECWIANTVGGLVWLPATFGLAGSGIGWVIGRTLPGPRLYEAPQPK
jgi:hypothetical protein